MLLRFGELFIEMVSKDSLWVVWSDWKCKSLALIMQGPLLFGESIVVWILIELRNLNDEKFAKMIKIQFFSIVLIFQWTLFFSPKMKFPMVVQSRCTRNMFLSSNFRSEDCSITKRHQPTHFGPKTSNHFHCIRFIVKTCQFEIFSITPSSSSSSPSIQSEQ